MKSIAFALICATLVVSSAEVDEETHLRQVDADMASAWPFGIPMGDWLAFGHGPRGGQVVATGHRGRWVAGGVGPKKAHWLAAGSRRRSDVDKDDHDDYSHRTMKDDTTMKQELHEKPSNPRPPTKEDEPTAV
ncbi:hypothetical protein Ae201684P_016290 [Aphanomyces euteiches]|uniref:RxLR effector protein n=1 Tax=Aphanomyces euteiches TaxID=100861 RepID=A0A6G0WGD5_9STRA|nr:hypothetical protein Ae201684_015654 [Aphanomyces euteiches]KAH9093665.1 hypothetical protein Ae201684P_016290 [Aphanomyces euteiches]